jgi:hypothetical protein
MNAAIAGAAANDFCKAGLFPCNQSNLKTHDFAGMGKTKETADNVK